MSSGNVNAELEISPVGMGIGKISQWVEYTDLTDSGTTGSLTMTQQLPAGAFHIGTKVTVKTGFTGDTSAVLTVGLSSGEDELTDGTSVNVYTAAVVGDTAEDPLAYQASAADVYLVVTTDSDFSDVSAGKMYVEVFYFSTVVELGKGHPDKYL